MHDAAASADGSLTVVAPHGEIRQASAELLGIDVIKGLGLYLAKDQSQTGVRCAVADFQASNGVLTARNLVLDTDPVLATGKGTVDMRTETINLVLQGHPKKFQLIRLNAPITVSGKIRSPKIGVKAGQVGVQVVAAVALGAFLSLVAAILPFVDVGLGRERRLRRPDRPGPGQGRAGEGGRVRLGNQGPLPGGGLNADFAS